MGQKDRFLFTIVKERIIPYIKKNPNSIFLIVLLSLGFVCATITLINNNNDSLNKVSSFFFASSFVVVFIWYLFCLAVSIRNNYKNKMICLLMISILFFISIANVLVNTPPAYYFSFAYYKKIILTFSVITFMLLLSINRFDYRIPIFIRIGYIVLVFVTVISFVSGIGKNYMHQSSKEMLRLTFANSNGAGIILTTLLCVGAYSFGASRKVWKFLLIVISLPLLYLLLLTKCRSAIFGLAVGVLLYFVFRLISASKRINSNKAVFILISAYCFFPILFSSIYVILGSSTNVLDYIGNLVGGNGKAFDSRMEVMTFAFQTIYKNPLFGHYFSKNRVNFAYGYQSFQIEWFIEEGLLPALSFFLLLIFILYKKYISEKDILIQGHKTDPFVPIVLFMIQIFIGTFESGMFIGMSGWYLLAFCFFGKFTENQNMYWHRLSFFKTII